MGFTVRLVIRGGIGDHDAAVRVTKREYIDSRGRGGDTDIQG